MDSTRRTFINKTAAVASGMAAGIAAGAPAQAANLPPAPSKATAPKKSKGARLRELLARPGLTISTLCLTAEHAAIAQHVGAECVYAGGSIMARTDYLYEDFGLILPNEMVEAATRMARAVDIPVITDADQAGETPVNTFRMVTEMCRNDIAGCHIEDTANPKHLLYSQGADTSSNRLISIDEMLTRIDAAVEAREKANSDLVIIIRTDAIFNQRGNKAIDPKRAEEDCIKRGIAYAKAGADVFMVQSMRLDQIDRIADAVPIPLCDDATPIADIRKTKLKLYLALTNTSLILDFLEATTRNLVEHDDFNYFEVSGA